MTERQRRSGGPSHRARRVGAPRSVIPFVGLALAVAAASGCSGTDSRASSSTDGASASSRAATAGDDAEAGDEEVSPDGADGADGTVDPCAGDDARTVFYALAAASFPAAACRAFALAEMAGQAKAGDPGAPAWIAPGDGATLDPNTWVVFQWSAGAAANAADADATGPAADADATGPAADADATGPAADADATPPASDGSDGGDDASTADVGYVVEFRQGDHELFRVLLEGRQWPVDVPRWTLLKGAGGPITATVVRVPLAAGTVDASRPILTSAPITFSFAS